MPAITRTAVLAAAVALLSTSAQADVDPWQDESKPGLSFDRSTRSATREQETLAPPHALPVQFQTPLPPTKPAGAVDSVTTAPQPSTVAHARSLPLTAPTQSSRTNARSLSGAPSPATLIGSLATVLGLFLLVSWALRRGMPRAAGPLPREALEVLGRASLTGRHQAHLVRLGNKLLLLSITPAGVETITEVTDPVEVDRLLGICLQNSPYSSTTAFRQILGQIGSGAEPGRQSGKTRKGPSDFDALTGSHSAGRGEAGYG